MLQQQHLPLQARETTFMKITMLGTGSPEPNVTRASSGYLVSIGSDNILLDCGGGIFDRLLQAGYRPSDISHLFFTHLHSDHMMDYGRLIHAAWDEAADENGQPPAYVFGPSPIKLINERLFGRQGVFAADLCARTEHTASQEVWTARGGSLPRAWPSPHITEIEPGYRYQSPNGWTLTSCRVPHAQPQLECLAFRIDYEGKSFVYSGDAALCEDLETLATDCDVLLHWCYRQHGDHSSPTIEKMSPDPVQIAQMASRIGARQLYLTHLRNSMDTEEAHQQIRDCLSAHFSGESYIAQDLKTIEL